MIAYKEFSSLVRDLGFSGKALYSVSNNITKHYHTAEIPKKNGGKRQLCVPDGFLRAIQKSINDKLLCHEEISPYATAYRPCASTRRNALPHIAQPVLLKLDIRDFFDRLIYPLVKEKAFPSCRYSEQNRILLSVLCTCKDTLPQGAPTSPAISNIIMKDFDNTVGTQCKKWGIAYTRYCDDMTFSGDFEPMAVKEFVEIELKKLGLFLNDKKTVVARAGQRQSVTGIVVNEKISVPSDYKRKIRSEMYYCKKYGIASHLAACNSKDTPESYKAKLLGRINYVLSAEPDNQLMKEYRKILTECPV